jgi:hypothetical protein
MPTINVKVAASKHLCAITRMRQCRFLHRTANGTTRPTCGCSVGFGYDLRSETNGRVYRPQACKDAETE